MISKLAELWVRLFKLGIVSREQLTADHLEGLLNSHKFIALDLYDGLDGLPEDEIDKIQERALGWFRIENGVLKNSRAHRFDSFDWLSFSVIAANYSPHQEVRVHDIGASDGRASCILYDLLNHRFAERLHFLATDSTPCLSILKRARGRCRLIVDDQLNVLHVIMPPFVLLVIRRPGEQEALLSESDDPPRDVLLCTAGAERATGRVPQTCSRRGWTFSVRSAARLSVNGKIFALAPTTSCQVRPSASTLCGQ